MSESHAGYIDITLNAEADLSNYQYYAIVAGSATRGCNLAGANGVVIGILQNKPSLNQEAVVRVFGFSKAMCDGSGTAIAVRSFLKADGSGHLIVSATNRDNVVGWAFDALSEAAPRVSEVFVNVGIMSHS